MANPSFEAQLRTELPKLVKDKIITKQQSERIVKRYPASSQDHNSRLVSIISTFGAILIGLGILTLVAVNWNEIPRVARVLILLIATFGSCAAGYVLRFRKSFPKVGSSLIFLSAILYGTTIVLIAQMYNLSSDTGGWLLLWAIGVLAAAYALESVSSLGLGLIVFSFWLAAQVARTTGGGQALERVFEMWPITVAVFLAFGAILWAIGSIHERWMKGAFVDTYQLLGAFFLLFNGYMLTWKWLTDGYWYSYSSFGQITSTTLLVLWSLIGLAIILLAGRLRSGTSERWTSITIAVAIIGGALIITHPTHMGAYPWDYNGPLFTPYSLITNLAYLGLLVGAVTLGIARKQAGLVNLVLLAFGVDVLSRYFEFFSDRLSGGTFFIVTGLILILAGVSLEKLRRMLVKDMEGA